MTQMNFSSSIPSTRGPHPVEIDKEMDLVQYLVTQVQQQVRIDALSVVNVYVACKSKPLLVLTGPTRSGKLSCLHTLMSLLTSNVPGRTKTLMGHPWWANGSGASVFLIDAQTRINTDIILNMIDEASQLENRKKAYMICMASISPGELTTFFANLAFQLNHGCVMALPTFHLTEPLVFPLNLSLVATLDTDWTNWTDNDLLSQTALVPWQSDLSRPKAPASNEIAPAISLPEQIFLQSRIRNVQIAFRKLHRLTHHFSGELAVLVGVMEELRKFRVPLSDRLLKDMIIYLSNAWSQSDLGLFDISHERNLIIALDFSFAQILLPATARAISNNSRLKETLLKTLERQFPQSFQYVGKL